MLGGGIGLDGGTPGRKVADGVCVGFGGAGVNVRFVQFRDFVELEKAGVVPIRSGYLEDVVSPEIDGSPGGNVGALSGNRARLVRATGGRDLLRGEKGPRGVGGNGGRRGWGEN